VRGILCARNSSVNGRVWPLFLRSGASASGGVTLGKMIIEVRRITVITDLGHPAFAVHDIDATLSFYKILGIEEAFRLNHDDGSLMLVYLHVSGDRFIEVLPQRTTPRPRQGTELRAYLPAYRRYPRGRRASARGPRAHRPRAPSRPRRQPASVDTGPRRERDRADATLRKFAPTANGPLRLRQRGVGIGSQIPAGSETCSLKPTAAGPGKRRGVSLPRPLSCSRSASR
jgi:catechol 2,3-dioxygenase-like lactoylglutathione lyase family enzyme